jgi:hypothetical protein
MSEFSIKVDGGSSVRLPTAGKYCDRDIVVSATDVSGEMLKKLIGSDITDFTLPKDTTKIGSYAFYKRGLLKITSLPDGLRSIGNYSFAYCTRLALTVLPSSLFLIGNNAFLDCTGLTELTFKGRPETIGDGVFTGCTNLVTINVPWAESEYPVDVARWGATNATINYNYKG